ncbi:MAG: hypothetical protein WA061_02905 [Microgenomates group bacterium]
MTFKDYVAVCKQMLKDDPSCGLLLVVSSADDEGNYFSPVFYHPSVGYYADGEFIQNGDDRKNDKTPTYNAICIN